MHFYHLNLTKSLFLYRDYHKASFKTVVFMVALWNRADHYIFILWFLLSSSFFFPRLISAAGDWMSAILPHMHGVALV